MNPQQYPTLEQFAAHMAVVNGKIEVIEQELYDRIIYPTAGLNRFDFFTTPRGAGVTSEAGAVAGSPKTDADTNMTQNGKLPKPQAFWIDGIEVDFEAGGSGAANTFTTAVPTVAAKPAAITDALVVSDNNIVLNAGWLQLFIGQKSYYQNGPLAYFPPSVQRRISVGRGNADTAAAGTATDVATSALWIRGYPIKLDPGLGLATDVNFGVTINFPALQATPSTFNGRIGVSLPGWLFRAAQ